MKRLEPVVAPVHPDNDVVEGHDSKVARMRSRHIGRDPPHTCGKLPTLESCF